MKRLNLPKEKEFIGPALIWKRIAAFFIDMVIINFVVLFPFRNLFKKIIPSEYSFLESYKFLSGSTSYMGFINSVSFIISILTIMYFFMLEAKMSQTIGKKFMNIYVASDAESNNGLIKPWQMLTRNLAFIPIFPFILLWALDPLSMLFTKTNQRLTEILSKTRVVEKFSFTE